MWALKATWTKTFNCYEGTFNLFVFLTMLDSLLQQEWSLLKHMQIKQLSQ